MIFDTHCHLNDPQLYEKIDEVIANAQQVGVNKFLVVGWDKNSSLLAIELAEQYDFVYAAIGFHPCNIEGVSDTEFDEVMSKANHPKVVAIGEIGLDYYWIKDEKTRELQRKWFIKQIDFANKIKKPISIHNRDAFSDCLTLLKEHKPLFGGVMHCYSGSVESLKDVLELGLNVGLGGPLTFTNAKTPKIVCEEIPLERLVVETDSPYLAPHPLRGTVNEPKNIALVVDEVARVRKMSKKHLLEVLYNTSCKMFHV
ncbi:MAG: TatD family hydrolase [Bacilli bacterium]|nr:TatD family hydrolase [Bacilli bacterium]